MKSIFRKLIAVLSWMFGGTPPGVNLPYSYMRGHGSVPMYYFNKKGGTDFDRANKDKGTGSEQ